MIKLVKFILLFFCIPLCSLSQDKETGSLRGTMIYGEKPVEFTCLTMPDGTTEIPIFNFLPTRDKYETRYEQEFLPLNAIKSINMMRFSEKESGFLHDSCSGCILYKARITFFDQNSFAGKTVFLAIKSISWKNSNTLDFKVLRTADLRFLEAVYFNETIE